MLALSEVQQELVGLTAMRERVSALGVEVAEQVGFYTRLITQLLAVVDQVSIRSQDATIALQTNAYAAFLQSKERMGLERATLSNVFARDSFTPALLQQFISSLPPRTPISSVSRRWRVRPSASCWPRAWLLPWWPTWPPWKNWRWTRRPAAVLVSIPKPGLP